MMMTITTIIWFTVDAYTAFLEKLIVAQISTELYICTETEFHLLSSWNHILVQLNHTHTLTSCFSTIRFNIIFRSASKSSKVFSPLVIFDHNFFCVHHCCMRSTCYCDFTLTAQNSSSGNEFLVNNVNAYCYWWVQIYPQTKYKNLEPTDEYLFQIIYPRTSFQCFCTDHNSTFQPHFLTDEGCLSLPVH